jgi:NAD(P)-dependent dehydrogenase (short-subunit alcohol dehydrogenase family)
MRAVEQNLLSVVRMSRAAVPHMRRAGGGSILNIAALSMLQPIRGFGLSVASWAGVMGLAKTLSLELAADGITINTLCPGLIDTPRLQLVTRQSGQAMEELAACRFFDMFQDEAKVAGRLLAGYSELEFALHDCLTQSRSAGCTWSCRPCRCSSRHSPTRRRMCSWS